MQLGKLVHLYLPGSEDPLVGLIVHVCPPSKEDSKEPPPKVNLTYFSSNGDSHGIQGVPFISNPTGDEDFTCCVEPPSEAPAKGSPKD